MLRLFGALALAAPLALGILLLSTPDASVPGGATVRAAVVALAAAVAGVTLTALVVAGYLRYRYSALVAALEHVAEGDYRTQVAPRSLGLERRLSLAVNAVAEALADTHDRATIDRLTGVANRQVLLAELFNEVERAGRYDRPLTVAFVDIDHFKPINDTYGHAAGDIVLRGVAQTIAANLRTSDLIGRYGGEEFMLILTETTVDEAAVLAEKVRALVQRQRFSVDAEHQLTVTISIGIAGGVGKQVRTDALVRNADAAMYSAKSLGRNQTYIFAEPDDDARVPSAPISAAGRTRAMDIGRQAREAAAAVLTSTLAPLPHYRGRPSAVIATVVVALARQLQLPDAEIDRLRLAALLHDVGKVAVPQEILDKPASLTTAEWRSVVQHPRIGQVILEQAAALRDAVPIILHHHERFAGHGYPHGLRAMEIPLGARIVAIADAYDAMIHDRPYKAAMSHEAAIAELRRHAGTQFDPELVELFCDLYADRAPEPDAAVVALNAAATTHDRMAASAAHTERPGPTPERRRRRTHLRPADLGGAATTDGADDTSGAGLSAEGSGGRTMAADGSLGLAPGTNEGSTTQASATVVTRLRSINQ